MTKHLLTILSVTIAVALPSIVAHHASADTLSLDARALFERALTSDLRLADDGKAIEIARDELIEDDGPAAGYSYKPNEEKLSATTWIKKEFLLADSRAAKATLLVGPGGKLQCTINGKAVPLGAARKVGGYWQAYEIPVETLKAGKNDVVLSGNGKVWIARDDEFAAGSTTRPRHPNRSLKSTDAGKTWRDDRLGVAGDIDGEYYVRLFLDRHRPEGHLTLPVIDVGNLANHALAPPLTSPGKVRVGIRGATGKILLRVRTGSTYVPDVKHWSTWEHIDDQAGTLNNVRGRFLQVAVVLKTANPLHSPSFREIFIEANPQRPKDWTKAVRLVESKNPEIVRTSIPFEYEPFDHPRLRKLRQDFKLDGIVAGAKSEFELITRLAGWSAKQWQRGHLRESYPPWDALEILKPHADKTPIGGFCQQYNVVFLQACESFGLAGRAVSLGSGDHGATIKSGHEVVEIWSNEHQKWVYVDGQLARYHIDVKTGQPLSLLELRERQVAHFRGKAAPAVKAVQIVDIGETWKGFDAFPPFFELRLIPRSNFLEKKSPLPLHQGMRGWFWTGHHVWTDADYPASMLYSQSMTHRRNWEWTLNQAHIVLEAMETPGLVRVHLDTETPGFEAFMASIDGKQKRTVSSRFDWQLHKGQNRLGAYALNSALREGVPSQIVLDYAGEP